jgi:predicted ribosome quality control (RQC) complex YloA/Tae2 family protein
MRVEYNKTWFVVGKSADHNWKIISDAHKDYFWVHANSLPSSHIIIEIDDPLEDEIQYACKLCKLHTKKITDPLTEYVITQVKNLKFGSKPGEVYFRDSNKIKITTIKV